MQYDFIAFYYEISIILFENCLQTEPFKFLTADHLPVAQDQAFRWAVPKQRGDGRSLPYNCLRRQGNQNRTAPFRIVLHISARSWLCQLKISRTGA